jgi:hypothetical protein
MTKRQNEITAEQVRECLDYDKSTGVFLWRGQRPGVKVGDIAGTCHDKGYKRICLDGKLYFAHRLAWLYVHGRWPAYEIDHINGVRDDNRIENLREATSAENHQNLGRQPKNTSGHPGVSWHRFSGKWYARIRATGGRRHLGYFDTAEEAAAAYRQAKSNLHPFQPTARGALTAALNPTSPETESQ